MTDHLSLKELPTHLLESDPVGAETLRLIYKMSALNQWIYDVIKPAVGRSAVEIGCGIGCFTELLLHLDRVYAFDINATYVEFVNQRFASSGKVKAMVQDAQHPLPAEVLAAPVDTVICFNVLEHIEDDIAALGHMRAALSPGGHLILLVPAIPFLFSSLDVELGHYRRYDRRTLDARVAQVGLVPVAHRYINVFGILGWFLNGKILRRKLLPAGQLDLYNKLVPAFRAIERLTGPPIGLSHIIWARRT